MNNCQIVIKDTTYNIFTKQKNKKKKSDFTATNEIRVVAWKDENPIDSFDMFQGSNNAWNAWICNTVSQMKINLRLTLEDYLNNITESRC